MLTHEVPSCDRNRKNCLQIHGGVTTLFQSTSGQIQNHWKNNMGIAEPFSNQEFCKNLSSTELRTFIKNIPDYFQSKSDFPF